MDQVFGIGVKEITTTPALFGDVLECEGKFYKVGTVRQAIKVYVMNLILKHSYLYIFYPARDIFLLE